MRLKVLKTKIARTTDYYLQDVYSSVLRKYRENDERGICSCCGKFSRFRYTKYFDANSHVVQSCGWDKDFTEVINITNTLDCFWCGARFRVRCPAQSLINHFWKDKVESIRELVEFLEENGSSWTVLETGSCSGIFSNYKNVKNIIKSEYYDDVERGQYRGEVRSEDLQDLSFDDNSLDAVISLDVFEHIPDPWKAFLEVNRVLKPGGIGIITVPLDMRIQETTRLATLEDGDLKYFRSPAYHLDHIREEGSLVFTEFGTDIVRKLGDIGCRASIDSYTTERTNVMQPVILLSKNIEGIESNRIEFDRNM